MKKLLFFAILFAAAANAQIVSIPDANFKARLVEANVDNEIAYGNGGYIKIDANSNGEIELAEAQAIDSLRVSYSQIGDMTGIAAFSNLKKLDCQNNDLSELDIDGLVSLKMLNCRNNEIATLNVTPLVNLESLDVAYNSISELSVGSLINLTNLSCSNNNLTALDVALLLNLQFLDCRDNDIALLEVGALAALKYLTCNGNNIPSLDLSQLENLETLYAGNPGMSVLDLSNLPTLYDMTLYNYEHPLDLSPLPNLMSFYLFDFPQPGVDISMLANLTSVGFYFTSITTIDASNNPFLMAFNSESNNALTYANLKNGSGTASTFISNCPNLTFVCANPDDVESIALNLQNIAGNNPNVVVSSYCTFTPGGDYNTINGTVRFDGDNNGCSPTDLVYPYFRVDLDGGNAASFTNAAGQYVFYTPEGSFDLSLALENPTLFTVNPATANVTFPDVNNNVATQDFCIQPVGVHPDLEVIGWSNWSVQPGFDTYFQIFYRNKGNQLLSGNINLAYEEPLLDFVSSFPAPDLAGAGALQWNFNNMMPFEVRTITVTLNVNGPTETPPVNIGDLLHFATTGTVTGDDEDLTNNGNDDVVIAQGSFDPNNKLCLEGEVVPTELIGEYLHYVINFENTGTAPATNIVVKDIIDESMFELSTLQVLQTSHPADIRLSGNVAEFIFQNINLEIGGHGNILLKIKTKPSLAVGSEVSNKADIFFDYNYPIETNLARTTFQSLGIGDPGYDTSVRIFPNPAHDVIRIVAASEISSVALFDTQGRLLETRLIGEAETALDLSSKKSGVYFLRVTTTTGMKTEKIMKQ